MTDQSPDEAPADQLAKTNALLAEWAARSAADSDRLVERLEGMGYAVRGKSEAEIEAVLKHPPGQAPAARTEPEPKSEGKSEVKSGTGPQRDAPGARG